MKRYLIIVLILVLAGSAAAIALSPIKIIIDGKEIQSDVPPQIINGRTMVPIRVIAENFGADVKWDGETNTVEITSPPETEVKNTKTEKNPAQDIIRLLNKTRPEVEKLFGEPIHKTEPCRAQISGESGFYFAESSDETYKFNDSFCSIIIHYYDDVVGRIEIPMALIPEASHPLYYYAIDCDTGYPRLETKTSAASASPYYVPDLDDQKKILQGLGLNPEEFSFTAEWLTFYSGNGCIPSFWKSNEIAYINCNTGPWGSVIIAKERKYIRSRCYWPRDP